MAKKIKCSNCGETITYDGKVCPHCSNDKSEDKERYDKNNKRSILVFLVFLFIFFFCAALNKLGGKDTEPVVGVTITEEPVAVAVEIIPTAAIEKIVIIDTLAKFETQLRKTLGDGNRDINRLTSVEIMAEDTLIVVIWAINDNLFANSISWGGKRDAADILEILSNSTFGYEKIQIKGTFSMIDALGNVEESIVVLAVYPKEIIDNINFENIDIIVDNIYDLAFDGGRIHSEFE